MDDNSELKSALEDLLAGEQQQLLKKAEDNLVLLGQQIAELTESEREDLDKAITELAIDYDLSWIKSFIENPKRFFSFSPNHYHWRDYLKWVFNEYIIEKLQASLLQESPFDKIKSLLELRSDFVYPLWYIPSFIYSWFEKHSEEWKEIASKIEYEYLKEQEEIISEFNSKYPNNPRKPPEKKPKEIDIKEFSKFLTSVLNLYDMFKDKDHFGETANDVSLKLRSALKLKGIPFKPYLIVPHECSAWLYAHCKDFKQKTDKYKERLKELTESSTLDGILNDMSKRKRAQSKRQILRAFYNAVRNYLQDCEKICDNRLGNDLLSDNAVMYKVLQDLRPITVSDATEASYVLHGMSPILIGEKYDIFNRASIMDRSVPLFVENDLVKKTMDVIDCMIAKGYLKPYIDSTGKSVIVLTDLAKAVLKWNEETPDHQVSLPDWLKETVKKSDIEKQTKLKNKHEVEAVEITDNIRKLVCKDQYIENCIKLILEKLSIYDENAKVTRPLLIEAFAYASNIKVVKKNHKPDKQSGEKTDLVFNEKGREINNFSYSLVEKVIKNIKNINPIKIVRKGKMGGKEYINNIRESLIKIGLKPDFDSFKKVSFED